MATKMSRRGISNVVATIILIAVAIALAVAVAVWVFGLAGSAAKTATLTVVQGSLTVSDGEPSELTFVINNPTGASISLSGFTLGSLSCTFQTPLPIPGGTTNGQLQIEFSTGSSGIGGSATLNGGTSYSFSCTGSQSFYAGVQYSGSLITTSGQTYPFTVTAEQTSSSGSGGSGGGTA